MRRIIQLLKYGVIHSKEIANQTDRLEIKIFLDILYCFFKYKMWSNEYKQEHFYLLNNAERMRIGKKYKTAGIRRDLWQKGFVKNRRFIAKYSDIKYECGGRRAIRNAKYTKEFSAGKNLFVEYGVDIYRQHYLDGKIFIGDSVILSKGCMIDYSGEVLIGNNVVISESSIILSHEHDIPELQARTEKKPIPKRTEIKAFAWIGAGATILPGRVIGEHAVVGAGSVVTHDVEPYDIVAGNPAKSIKKRKGSTDIG